jgi:hypothetical protein
VANPAQSKQSRRAEGHRDLIIAFRSIWVSTRLRVAHLLRNRANLSGAKLSSANLSGETCTEPT